MKHTEEEFIFDPAMGISQGYYLNKPKLDSNEIKHTEKQKICLDEFNIKYKEQTEEERFDELYKDYLFYLRKKNVPLLPQELEKFCKVLGLKKENPTKKEIVIFLLNKTIY